MARDAGPPAGFDSALAYLTRNKAIREFVGVYSGRDLPEVIKLTLIYGILGLQSQFKGGCCAAGEGGGAHEGRPHDSSTVNGGTSSGGSI